MLLTGGSHGAFRRVAEYSVSGYIRDLPSFQDKRWFHGCTYYYNEDGVRTFLVTGGIFKEKDEDPNIPISSTELLVETDQAWRYAGNLPSPRTALIGKNIDSRIFMTGERTVWGFSLTDCQVGLMMRVMPGRRSWSGTPSVSSGKLSPRCWSPDITTPSPLSWMPRHCAKRKPTFYGRNIFPRFRSYNVETIIKKYYIKFYYIYNYNFLFSISKSEVQS